MHQSPCCHVVTTSVIGIQIETCPNPGQSSIVKLRVYFFKPIPFSLAFFFEMCILLTHSFKTVGLEGLQNPPAAKSSRFSRLSRDLGFVKKLAVSLAKPTLEFQFKRGK